MAVLQLVLQIVLQFLTILFFFVLSSHIFITFQIMLSRVISLEVLVWKHKESNCFKCCDSLGSTLHPTIPELILKRKSFEALQILSQEWMAYSLLI